MNGVRSFQAIHMRMAKDTIHTSHCESLVRTTICCLLPANASPCQAETRHSRKLGYDNLDRHEDIATGGRSVGLQDESGGPGRCIICGHWRARRTSPGAP